LFKLLVSLPGPIRCNRASRLSSTVLPSSVDDSTRTSVRQ
jgi:hypothetical protein